MKTAISWKKFKRIHTKSAMTVAMAGILIMVSIFTAVINQNKVQAASATVSIDLINYGGDSTAIDNTIINAHPAFIVDNSPAGPWKGNANISIFMSAGIKYFEYLDGGYEGTEPQAIPNDLTSNLNYITAAAKAGAYGIFLDEVSASPNAASISYLSQIYNAAHALGLKVAFNTGVDSWSDSLMNYCDYINSSEVWSNAPLTASQKKWASRTWLLTEGVNDATTAANLTKEAWADGILAEYACSSYESIPGWLPTYYSLISGNSPVVTAPSITTATLANGTVGTIYSQTLAASGGTAPYTWTVSAGSLPAGLTLNTNGVISGTPTTSNASSFTVKVTDSASATATQSLTMTVNNAAINTAISVTTTTIANGTLGTTYSRTLTATGGTKPYTWTVSAGTLPAGLTLSTGGVISGMPTAVVSKALTFKVTDSRNTTATKSLTITINSAAISINLTALANGTVGTAYSQTLTASGGTAPYAWAITAGTLPAGLTLSPAGVISGTPSVSCLATTVTCQVTDSLSNIATQPIAITINNSTISIATTTLANATVGIAYSQTLTASGGTAPYTWAITTGTLPAGLTLSTNGVISGTPSTPCNAAPVTWQLTDSLGNIAIQSLSITVNNAVSALTTSAGNTTGLVASVPVSSGAANEYDLYLQITSTSASGITAGQQVWCAASTTDFPNLLTLGATLTGNLDNSSGWWTFKTAATTVTVTTPPTGKVITVTVSGNATGVVASTPVASGGANEYCFYLKITSTNVTGLTVGQRVWCAATTTSFPNLLTVGSTITGTLNNSLGWWVIQ